MKIAIINQPHKHQPFNENLAVVDDEFGIYNPLDIMYIAALMEKEGHEVFIIDGYAEKIGLEETTERIRAEKPDLLCSSLHSAYNVQDDIYWLTHIKKELNLPVLVGGYNFNLYPEDSMHNKCIDYAIIGDALESLPKFLKAFPKRADIIKIEGVCYREHDGTIRINKPPSIDVDVRKLPKPARHLVKNDKYYQFISKRKNFAIMMTQTGCPYPCTFCTIPNYKYSKNPAEVIFDEILDCYNNHGIREIDFFDAVFTLNKPLLHEVCDLIIKNKLDLYWSCRSRIDNCDRELLKKMAESGCKRIYFGIESVDPEAQKNSKKVISDDKTENIIKWAREFGIRPLGFFMVGLEGDTPESLMRNVKYAKKLKLDYAQFSETIAKPKTALDRQIIQETGRDFWAEFIRGDCGGERLPTPWTKLTPEQTHRLAIKSYLSFYLTPRNIMKNLVTLQSFHEFYRYSYVVLKMMFDPLTTKFWGGSKDIYAKA